MVLALDVALQLGTIEVHVSQIARAVSRGLIVEVRRRRIAALAAGRDRPGPHAIAEFDDCHEAVPARAVHLLGSLVRARAEGRQRAPPRGGETDGDARAGVVERLDDIAGETLESIDVTPGRFPAPEVARELVGGRGQG